MYLTYSEYMNLGFAEMDEAEYNRLLKKASDVVDGVTRNFYKLNSIQDDVDFRRDQFKKAIGAQIEYFYEMGATNSHGLNEPTNVTIGRTSIGRTSIGRNSGSNAPQNGLISPDVFLYLQDTGLLYAGIGVV